MVLRILLVDDHGETRGTLRKLLELWGHEVCDAASGFAAIEGAADFDPHVAIVDLDLSGSVDGYAVGRALRDGARAPRRGTELPMLIAYTRRGDADEQRRAHEAGFEFFLVKPGGLGELQLLLAVAETQALRQAI